ncbi:MAG: hypothetical protein WD378_00655, partial [Egicoccus sp.]
RIGDYAKNLFDLAADGARLETAPDAEALTRMQFDISRLISDAGDVFGARDTDRAREVLMHGDQLLDDFDDRVSDLVRGDDQGPEAVARALTYRYLKRIVAHLMNVLSAVVVPIDRLDYFDEDPEDRR